MKTDQTEVINKRRLTEDDFCTTGTQNKSKQTNETPKRLEKRTREMDPHLLFVIFHSSAVGVSGYSKRHKKYVLGIAMCPPTTSFSLTIFSGA